jgi:HlyD family secretion protein
MTATANITVQEVHDALLVPNAALRFVPPSRPASDNGRQQSGGSILSRLFPRPRHDTQEQKRSTKGEGQSQRVWMVRGEKLVPVPVTTGSSDGAMTEITGGNLKVGQEVVVDIAAAKA